MQLLLRTQTRGERPVPYLQIEQFPPPRPFGVRGFKYQWPLREPEGIHEANGTRQPKRLRVITSDCPPIHIRDGVIAPLDRAACAVKCERVHRRAVTRARS